ncbi:hypothetical protein MXD81_31360 [Microbacteriaceae bacterium K1510]|nr:hypothetical protein [Microbacteriaceae bacterium K1510]
MSQTITPEPIVLPANVFPTPSAQLEKMIADQDDVSLRLHAWTLWAGLSADSTQTYQGQRLPIWETWLSEQEAFSDGAQSLVAGQARNLRPFARPRQFRHVTDRDKRSALQFDVASAGPRLLAFVKLSPDAAVFLGTPQITPPGSGQPFSLKKVADLDRLSAYFDQYGTPVADRKIADFPAAATDLKVVFIPVKATGFTPIPLWAGPSASSNPANPSSDTWQHCVAVDSTNTKSGTTPVRCNGKTEQAEIVPINKFYSIRVDASSALSISRALNLRDNQTLAAGDFQVVSGGRTARIRPARCPAASTECLLP